MAKLIMWNLMTLDGFFSGPGGDLDFMQYAWGPELESFIHEQATGYGTIVFGRATYEGMFEYWRDKTDFIGRIMNDTPKVVFSKSLVRAEWTQTRVARGDLRTEVARVKDESAKDAFVLGSGALCANLAREHLFDEYRVAVVSLLLGAGTRLFPSGAPRLELERVEARSLGPRAMLLRYVPKA